MSITACGYGSQMVADIARIAISTLRKGLLSLGKAVTYGETSARRLSSI